MHFRQITIKLRVNPSGNEPTTCHDITADSGANFAVPSKMLVEIDGVWVALCYLTAFIFKI